MRRYPLPPSDMWPHERPLVHVLNGCYPAADLRRMSLSGLERLVAKLVQRTSKPTLRPQWWPSDFVFKHPLDLGLNSEREIKLAFKQLIVSCCQFFRTNAKRGHVTSKNAFLNYLQLTPKSEKKEVKTLRVGTSAPKLSTCPHIPLSSDIGRVLAAKEQYTLSEEVKLRRLERCEWYINKELPKPAETEFELVPSKEPSNYHLYKFPKRQFRQKMRSIHDAQFLARFCRPVKVVLKRLDITKMTKTKQKKLLVLIRDSEKKCCDLKTDSKFARTSSGLNK